MNLIIINQYDKKCGERGIRTLVPILPETRFPGVRLRPLGHLSFARERSLFLASQITKKNIKNTI